MINITLYAADRIRVDKKWRYKGIISPFTRLYLITAGDAWVRYEGRKFRLTPGSLVLVPPFHAADYHCENRLEKYYLLFTAKLESDVELFRTPPRMGAVPAAPNTKQLFRRLLEIHPDRQLRITNPKDKKYIPDVLGRPRPCHSRSELAETQALTNLLLIPFLRQLDEQQPAAGGRDAMPQLSRVVEYIHGHLDQPLTLEALGRIANLHPTYFSDLFFKQFGVRPSQYIQTRRMEKAQLLLSTTSGPIKAIAQEVGFADPNYFHKTFKTSVGITPTSFRRQTCIHSLRFN